MFGSKNMTQKQPLARVVAKAGVNLTNSSCSNILHEVELGSTFGNMLLQLAILQKFVARQVACGGGNTGNKALQLAKQQCCGTSCKEMLPVLLDL